MQKKKVIGIIKFIKEKKNESENEKMQKKKYIRIIKFIKISILRYLILTYLQRLAIFDLCNTLYFEMEK